MSPIRKLARRYLSNQIALGTYGPFGWWPYRIPVQWLKTHMYIVGRSGSGKSKFIEGLVWQLILAKQGVAFIDPHADSAQHLLKLLAHYQHQNGKNWLEIEENADRLIYCEPGRQDFVTPWNIFKVPGDPYTIATNVWEAFRRTWSQSLSSAPQSKNIALHSMLLLIEHQLTLAELPRLFIDTAFRQSLVNRCTNPDVVMFFQNRFDAWGKQALQRAEPLLNKVTSLTLNANLRSMLGAYQNRLDLRQIMDQGQVLIVNLGYCDLETRALMGSLFTVNLEQAAMSRIKLPSYQRKPFYCIIDEFQGFVDSDGSSHILSETRKAGMRFGFAHQGQYQLPSTRFQSTQEQTPLKIIFGCGEETARSVAREVFKPEKKTTKVESVSKQRDSLIQTIKDMPPRRIIAWRLGDKVRHLRTMPVPDLKVPPKVLEETKVTLLKQSGATSTTTSSMRKKKPYPDDEGNESFMG